jgi:hypothetical protein
MIARLSVKARDRILAAITALIDAAPTPGTLEIFGGQQPASADDGVGAQQPIASLTFSRPAFGTPLNGVIGARPIDQRPAMASGTASWARILDGRGNAILDIDVGESGAALNLTSTQLFEHGPVVINALVLRMPAA